MFPEFHSLQHILERPYKKNALWQKENGMHNRHSVMLSGPVLFRSVVKSCFLQYFISSFFLSTSALYPQLSFSPFPPIPSLLQSSYLATPTTKAATFDFHLSDLLILQLRLIFPMCYLKRRTYRLAHSLAIS